MTAEDATGAGPVRGGHPNDAGAEGEAADTETARQVLHKRRAGKGGSQRQDSDTGKNGKGKTGKTGKTGKNGKKADSRKRGARGGAGDGPGDAPTGEDAKKAWFQWKSSGSEEAHARSRRKRDMDAFEGSWPVDKGPTDFDAFLPTLDVARKAHPHLALYIKRHQKANGPDIQYEQIVAHDIYDKGFPSLLYPVGDPVYVHILPDPETGLTYHAIEPELDEVGEQALAAAKQMIFRQALYESPPEDRKALARTVEYLFEHNVHVGDSVTIPKIENARDADPTEGLDAFKSLLEEMRAKIVLPRDIREQVRYRLLRDLAGAGPLEPLMRDPYIEDIHSIGVDHCFVIHKLFGMIKTNIEFNDAHHVDQYVENLSERIGRPVSEANPIVDATLEDGSRINIVYSDNVSKRGPSFSIRRVAQEPIAITRLIQWGTLTPQLAAYLWLCLENGMSLFICGDAACGKTTSLNALLSFVNPRSKIYTAEDTPEVIPPHQVWQRLMTRETGPEEGRVQMFDLLKAALRSRPNYIVVGEIRGAEGAVAFQAMQTGHPCIASFHAASVQKMIQRLTSAPIHVPLTFIDNLNVAIIQKVIRRGDRIIRRITDIAEIEGYSELDGGVLTRPVFTYDAQTDAHKFRGRNNSYILEKKIAETLGYADPREIYDDLDERARVLEAMVQNEIFRYEDVNELVDQYSRRGITALPFTV